MPPSSSSFTRLNHPQPVPNWMGSFTLSAPPNTDLWRKPPSRDTSTAPILYTALRSPFIAAEVTVSADWELEWDQGGLVIFAGAPPGRVPNPNAPSPSPSTSTSSTDGAAPSNPSTSTSPTTDLSTTQPQPQPQPRRNEPPPPYMPPPPASKWVKAGLEFYNNAPHASAVCATSDGADWALAPLFPPSTSPTSVSPTPHPTPPLRVKLERVGHALWIWFSTDVDVSGDGLAGGAAGGGMDRQLQGGGWRKLREVTWFFWGVEDKAVRVGVYASRPAGFGGSTVWAMRNGGANTGGEGRGLVVEFEGLEIF
ncbi:hypothetical protein FGG08_006763 [Glutinoglossum americanum]|uniref:Uncharacterized protein n=1 Tax=Glutinoglossum americanum TaxID=1670608 RepID=A0A9P8KUM9_9PEZI|nr:hypothetical protein FGG08_006763 [Glutinoglossum americanum]